MPFPMIPAASDRALETFKRLGVKTWVHDKVYGLVSDPNAPHGFRLVASAETYDELATKLEQIHAANGSL
jgi:hypothetical protein